MKINKIFKNIIILNFALKLFKKDLIKYPTAKNLTYFWNYGSLAGLFLSIQLITGFLLTLHYLADINSAFNSIELIMKDLEYGWLLRYIHSNGASFFFITIYIHILKALHFNSYLYPRHILWSSGIIIFVLSMGAAFLGYVLPWGQMSFRAATVITNLLTVLPYFGKDLVYWIWGGFNINYFTLSRFYSLHFIIPFIITVMVIYHLFELHIVGSSNYLSNNLLSIDKINFFPYFVIKDLFGLTILLIFFIYMIFFNPEYLSHSDNYIRANPLITPSHIVPEWYFLPYHAVLRSILDKVYGITFMALSIGGLLLLPFLIDKYIKNNSFNFIDNVINMFLVVTFIMLGILGMSFPISPFIEIGCIMSHILLLYYFLILPFFALFNLIIFKNYKESAVETNLTFNKNIFKILLIIISFFFIFICFSNIWDIFNNFELFMDSLKFKIYSNFNLEDAESANKWYLEENEKIMVVLNVIDKVINSENLNIFFSEELSKVNKDDKIFNTFVNFVVLNGNILPLTIRMYGIIVLYIQVNLIIYIIFFLIVTLIFFIIELYNSSYKKKRETYTDTQESFLDVLFVLGSSVIIVLILVLSLAQLYSSDSINKFSYDLLINVVGHQWYWTYTYKNSFSYFLGYSYFDNLLIEKKVLDGIIIPSNINLTMKFNRLLQVDYVLTIPVNTWVGFNITSNDVIHSWSLPNFGIKQDAIPGRLNMVVSHTPVLGLVHGQCSELCGASHAFMPIVCNVVEKEHFLMWYNILIDVKLESIYTNFLKYVINYNI